MIGRPSVQQPAPPAGDGEVTGAVEGSVDEQARNALADLEIYWAERFPEVYGQPFEPLAGGYFSVDPGDVNPADYPRGVGCGADPGRRRTTPSTASPRRRRTPTRSPRPCLPGRAGGRARTLPARPGDGPRVRPRRPGARRPARDVHHDRDAGRPPGRAWTAWVAAGEARTPGCAGLELDELLRGYFLLRDPVGTSSAEESAHGSYFDRVSGFQDGFDGGPETCRDEFGPDRVFTQGEFIRTPTSTGAATRRTRNCSRSSSTSLPAVWEQAFRDVFGERFRPPEIESSTARRPPAPLIGTDLVFCPTKTSWPSTRPTSPGRPTNSATSPSPRPWPFRTAWRSASSWGCRSTTRRCVGAVPGRLVRRQGLQPPGAGGRDLPRRPGRERPVPAHLRQRPGRHPGRRPQRLPAGRSVPRRLPPRAGGLRRRRLTPLRRARR